MVKSAVPIQSACSLQVIREKRWPYDEYYFGDKDEKDRKTGQGENHWTGAESIEWYTGSFFRDMMHGLGDYRWRHLDPDGAFVTYEGHFYANRLHGYGAMSYPDGRVYTGLYYNDVRWGPGIERTSDLKSNVGLWRGTQLARLSWRPPSENIAPDLTKGPLGPAYLNPFRIELFKKTRVLGQTNSAIELLKKSGAEPKYASENFSKLYGNYCTDLESPICHRELFEYQYYNNNISMLDLEDDTNHDEESQNPSETNKEKGYYAWNNNEMTVHMMRHTYLHEKQRKSMQLKLDCVLNGPRKKFRPAAKHELDCRKLLLSSYLGHIVNVAQLINEEYVYPDLCDMQGNTALMYAACGDEVDVIHFLAEAGASVDAYNDSCCTPLAVALMRYIALSQSVSAAYMIPLFVAPAAKVPKKEEEPTMFEWMINRDPIQPNQKPTTNGVGGSKQNLKSAKSMQGRASLELKKKIAEPPKPKVEHYYESDDDTDEKLSLNVTQQTFVEIVDFLYDETFGPNLTPYFMFEFQDLMHIVDIDIPRVEILTKKVKQPAPKQLSEKLSAYGGGQKQEQLYKIKDTILQLLSEGANPNLIRCPQPAIVLAMKTKSTELVEAIVANGADINEKFPEFQDYTVLDMLLAEPYSKAMLEMLKKLLELGADATHFLHYPVDNNVNDTREATLLHTIIARNIEAETEDIRAEIMKILIQYNCDPRPLYDGWSVVEVAMTKNLQLLEIFIKGGTDLNMIINSNNQTILGKMFSIDFYKTTIGQDKFQILTDLLLYGADPLIECYEGNMRYRNVFEYARDILNKVCPKRPHSPPMPDNQKSKNKSKSKLKSESRHVKQQEEEKKKDKDKKTTDEWTEYRGSLDLMTECARLLHIRWLQANLVKELIDVIWTYKHRPWVMMIKEHKNRHRFTLWVGTTRCFEIWDILKGTKRKRYNNTQVLRALLCIAQFYQKQNKETKPSSPYIMTASERDIIESDVGCLLKEYNTVSKLAQEVEALKHFYVKPELVSEHDYKFQVCFECALPLDSGESTITCNYCQLVHFCDMKCLNKNVARFNCHPCSEILKHQYFPVTEEESINENYY